MEKIWFYFIEDKRASDKETILASLRAAGVVGRDWEPGSSGGRGCIFFKEVTGELCDFVLEVSRRGIEQVLAIALPDAELNREDYWTLMASGAADVVAWDFSPSLSRRVAATFRRWAEVDVLVESRDVRERMVGRSPQIRIVLRKIMEIARFTDAAVLILGESGTGKELAAKLIHHLDSRQEKQDIVLLDCTTIVPELSGSEFFGHERGAFTGAVNAREGAFALADKGTLLLDEIGELPMGLQAQLLRVIQEGTYKRVGGNTWHQTAFRLISATNKDLRELVKQGLFRHDLYYRMATWIFQLPPLRERTDEILPLTRHFLRDLFPGGDPPELDEPVKNYLLTRDYPGNIRELQQVVTRMGHRHVGPGSITVGDIPPEDRPPSPHGSYPWYGAGFENSIRRGLAQGIGLKKIGRTAEEIAVRLAVDNEKGSLQRAAQKLGVTARALQMRRKNRRKNDIRSS